MKAASSFFPSRLDRTPNVTNTRGPRYLDASLLFSKQLSRGASARSASLWKIINFSRALNLRRCTVGVICSSEVN